MDFCPSVEKASNLYLSRIQIASFFDTGFKKSEYTENRDSILNQLCYNQFKDIKKDCV